MARLYGVRCWPTTISVNPDGMVVRVPFGVAHLHAKIPDDKRQEAS